MDGPGQIESNTGLATTMNGQRHPEILRILQFLLLICQRLL
jgi:hypothetical protein